MTTLSLAFMFDAFNAFPQFYPSGRDCKTSMDNEEFWVTDNNKWKKLFHPEWSYDKDDSSIYLFSFVSQLAKTGYLFGKVPKTESEMDMLRSMVSYWKFYSSLFE